MKNFFFLQLARFRTEAEQQRLELQKLHSTETERLLEKVNENTSITLRYLVVGIVVNIFF